MVGCILEILIAVAYLQAVPHHFRKQTLYLLEACTIMERPVTNVPHCQRKGHLFQACASHEYITGDGLEAVADYNLLNAVAVCKATASNRGNPVRDHNGRQRIALSKGIVADGCNTFSKLIVRCLAAAIERIMSDSGNALLHNDLQNGIFVSRPGLAVARIIVHSPDTFKGQHTVTIQAPGHCFAAFAGVKNPSRHHRFKVMGCILEILIAIAYLQRIPHHFCELAVNLPEARTIVKRRITDVPH